MDAANTYQVFDELWSSGQLSERDVRQLPSMGITVVVNLALPSSPGALSGEAELVASLGLVYAQIPVEWEHPRIDQFVQFASLMNALQGEKIWVHCALNMRVSVFIYLYRRLILHEEEDRAFHPMREVWDPNETWQAFIRDVTGYYAAQS